MPYLSISINDLIEGKKCSRNIKVSGLFGILIGVPDQGQRYRWSTGRERDIKGLRGHGAAVIPEAKIH
jgi:hypothetical protein